MINNQLNRLKQLNESNSIPYALQKKTNTAMKTLCNEQLNSN